MINNDILRRISAIFKLTDEQVIDTFALGQCIVSTKQLTDFLKEKNDGSYQGIEDVQFASFLNGLIISKRGQNDGPDRLPEQILTNNMIFNKLKIALALKADEVIAIFSLVDFPIDKHELSSFFRSESHKNYKKCPDNVLSAFLKGLKTQSV